MFRYFEISKNLIFPSKNNSTSRSLELTITVSYKLNFFDTLFRILIIGNFFLSPYTELDDANKTFLIFFILQFSTILKKPLILLRKKNKLPAETHSVDFELEYGEATMEVHKDSIEKNDNVLLIDDLIATGGTAEAAAKLIEISKGKVAGFVFVINLFDIGGCDKLLKKGFKVENLIEFPGH